MDQGMKKEWQRIQGELLALPADQRDHFGLLLTSLAKCYIGPNRWKAVVIIDADEQLRLFSAGADEFEAAGLVQMAHDAVGIAVTADAPEKQMYN